MSLSIVYDKGQNYSIKQVQKLTEVLSELKLTNSIVSNCNSNLILVNSVMYMIEGTYVFAMSHQDSILNLTIMSLDTNISTQFISKPPTKIDD